MCHKITHQQNNYKHMCDDQDRRSWTGTSLVNIQLAATPFGRRSWLDMHESLCMCVCARERDVNVSVETAHVEFITDGVCWEGTLHYTASSPSLSL